MATIDELDAAVTAYKESLVSRFEAAKVKANADTASADAQKAAVDANTAFEQSKQLVSQANAALVEVARALNEV